MIIKVLVVEDNPILGSQICKILRKWHVAETVRTASEALHLVANNKFDTVLLDLGLPDMTGTEACKQLRSLSSDLSIMIVSAVSTSVSKVELLDTGADDYLTKPFNTSELVARVNALARRRARSETQATLSVGDLQLYPGSRRVTREGKDIVLRKKEFDILEYLMVNKGRVMSRQMIVNHAWSSTSSSWIGSVDVHIKQLRDKVDKPFASQLIKTSYGVGYMIEAPKIIQDAKESYEHSDLQKS